MHQDSNWYEYVGLSPADFVLDGDPVPSPKRVEAPNIVGPCLLFLAILV